MVVKCLRVQLMEQTTASVTIASEECENPDHFSPQILHGMQVQYDTFITVYMSDCDFYPRVRAAGYRTLNYPEVRCFSAKSAA
jgi:hypothetical protein